MKKKLINVNVELGMLNFCRVITLVVSYIRMKLYES